MRITVRLLSCAVALLIPVTASAAAGQPEVLAAWSQILGETSLADAHLPAPPTVEMRFVVPASTSCGDFQVGTRQNGNSSWTVSSRPPVKRPSVRGQLGDIDVCSYSETAWYEAQLMYKDSSGQPQTAVLTSNYPTGSTQTEVAKKNMTSGVADGERVIVKGPLWIGGPRGQSTNRSDLVMITLGDTGCRGVESGTTAAQCPRDRFCQHCVAAEWHFAEIAGNAAASSPDLVVHVGDYRYFLERTVSGDSWLYWQKDFFPAAQPLLLAAPWVFSRGNHESCRMFGDAYFQFFGTPTNNSCVGAMKPWYFDVAAGGLVPHRFVVIDNSYNHSRHLEENYEHAITITSANGAPASAWWVGHIPPINLAYFQHSEHKGDSSVRGDLYDAIEKEGLLCPAGRCRPSTYLLGHEHMFQQVILEDDNGNWIFPQQYIVGHGGVKADKASPAPDTKATCGYGGFPFRAKVDRGGRTEWIDCPDRNDADCPDMDGVVTTQVDYGFVKWTRAATTANLPAGWKDDRVFVTGPRRSGGGESISCFR